LNRVNYAEEQYDQEYDDAQGNPAEQLQASLRKQYQEFDQQNYINVPGNHGGVDYEEYIPPMRDYPRPDEPRKGKAYLTKLLQKWDWTQTDTHDEAIAVLQDERMQDEQQLIHQSLTQLGINWGEALPMYPVRFRTTDGQIKTITIGADDTGSDLIKNAKAFYGKWLANVRYHGQYINENVTVLENGLIPGWSNILEVTYKPEMVVNAQGICSLQEVMPQVRVYTNQIPDRLTEESSKNRVNHEVISEILQEVITLNIQAESLARIVDKLRTITADKIRPYQVEVYTILKKYGQYVRKQLRKKKYKQLCIGITTHDGIRIQCLLPVLSRVKVLRDDVMTQLHSPIIVHLELLGRRLDDDEYLIDCGCNPRTTNEVRTVYLMAGEREIEIPPSPPDDGDEVSIPVTNHQPVLPPEDQEPTRRSIMGEPPGEVTHPHLNTPRRENVTLPEEQSSTSYHRHSVSYQHQVDSDASNENIAPDSLGTPNVRRKLSPMSHLVFTPIVRQSAEPIVQLELVHKMNRKSPRNANDIVLQDITNHYIDPFEEKFSDQFREEARRVDTEALHIQRG